MKKVLPLVLALILLTFNVTVDAASFSEDSFEGITVQQQYINGDCKIDVKGRFERGDSSINILVTESGTKLDDLDNGNGQIQTLGEVQTDENGYFSYSFVLNIPADMPKTEYSIYISAKAVLPKKAAVVFGYGSEELSTEIKTLVESSKEQLEQLIRSGDFSELLGLDSFNLMNNTDISDYAGMLYKNMDDIDKTLKSHELYNEFRKFAVKYAILLSANKNIDVFGDDGDFICDGFYSLENIDTDNGITVYDCYKNELTDEGKKLVQNELLNNNYSSFDDFEKDFAQKTILYGLKYHQKNGYGHCGKLLTKENKAFAGFKAPDDTISDYQLSELSQYCDKNVFPDIISLENYIKSIKEKNDKPSGGSSGGGGSSGRSGSKTAVIPTVNEIKNDTDNIEVLIFKDMTSAHWAAKAVANLKAEKIISGDDLGMFYPDSYITREQMVKIICEALDLEALNGNELSFRDVKKDAWYFDYIKAASDNGIIEGISNDTFGVGINISRQDVCVMLVRAFGFSASGENLVFNDSENIASYARDAVDILSSNSIVNGYEDNEFKPKNNCTRAEAATILYKCMLLNNS